ncbi:unnamed protein product [Rotaria sp. Silwood2]|nr:unnamed protein product [Rotaria sp. Silwood2]CAF3301413.1 unnamed protein product [Rotaria sp. Silwood2]CAF3395144.1 unnamed protein product [Rotaria sp. Silwood2]CAF4097489.1 unnamed protein product [Rotaria sp. Silwood2]CAF4435484.1 unnamed protein product [Rotaria sp. Silwood2]
MTEYKTTGPTLAITDETSSSITDSNTTITTTLTSLMLLNPNNNNRTNNPLSHSNTSFSSTDLRYNNNHIFDGYHILRGRNRNNNY